MLNVLSIIQKSFSINIRLSRYTIYKNLNIKTKIYYYYTPTKLVTYNITIKDIEVKKERIWLNDGYYNLNISRIEKVESENIKNDKKRNTKRTK